MQIQESSGTFHFLLARFQVRSPACRAGGLRGVADIFGAEAEAYLAIIKK